MMGCKGSHLFEDVTDFTLPFEPLTMLSWCEDVFFSFMPASSGSKSWSTLLESCSSSYKSRSGLVGGIFSLRSLKSIFFDVVLFFDSFTIELSRIPLIGSSSFDDCFDESASSSLIFSKSNLLLYLDSYLGLTAVTTILLLFWYVGEFSVSS